MHTLTRAAVWLHTVHMARRLHGGGSDRPPGAALMGDVSLLSLQLPPGVGPAGVPLGCLWTGFLCTLLASPGAQLLSLLFRLSQVPGCRLRGPGRGGPGAI